MNTDGGKENAEIAAALRSVSTRVLNISAETALVLQFASTEKLNTDASCATPTEHWKQRPFLHP